MAGTTDNRTHPTVTVGAGSGGTNATVTIGAPDYSTYIRDRSGAVCYDRSGQPREERPA